MADKPNTRFQFKDIMKPIQAVGTAFKESLKTKTKNPLEKISVFFSTFMAELGDIGKKREKVKKKTGDSVKDGVKKTLDEKTGGKKVELAPDTAQDEKEAFEQAEAMIVANLDALPEGEQEQARSALNKIADTVDGGDEQMDGEESLVFGQVATKTILDLKEKYGTEDKFRDGIGKIFKASDKTDYPLRKVLGKPLLEIFYVDPMKAIDVAGNFGIEMEAANLLGGGEAFDLKNALDRVQNESLTPNGAQEVATVLGGKLLPNTPKNKTAEFILEINKLINSGSDSIDPATFAKLSFLIDNADLRHIHEKLGA